MRFLCDVHIPIALSKQLAKLGHDSEHVNNILDKWHTSDQDIIAYPDAEKRILITKDQDFRDSYLLNKCPNKLIKINLGNVSNQTLFSLFTENINVISELNNQNELFMVEINQGDFWVVTK
ncbi:MAG: putative nuclease of putative toxin-antitoxin system [Marinoscillum sp.]